MLRAEKQKAWLSDQAFAGKYGFETVNTTPDGYRLLALSFDGTKPHFAESAKRCTCKERWGSEFEIAFGGCSSVKRMCRRHQVRSRKVWGANL